MSWFTNLIDNITGKHPARRDEMPESLAADTSGEKPKHLDISDAEALLQRGQETGKPVIGQSNLSRGIETLARYGKEEAAARKAVREPVIVDPNDPTALLAAIRRK